MLLVHSDGNVKLLSSTGSALPVVNVGAFSGTPAAPAIDPRAVGAVAYVPAPAGFIYAVQIPGCPHKTVISEILHFLVVLEWNACRRAVLEVP